MPVSRARSRITAGSGEALVRGTAGDGSTYEMTESSYSTRSGGRGYQASGSGEALVRGTAGGNTVEMTESSYSTRSGGRGYQVSGTGEALVRGTAGGSTVEMTETSYSTRSGGAGYLASGTGEALIRGTTGGSSEIVETHESSYSTRGGGIRTGHYSSSASAAAAGSISGSAGSTHRTMVTRSSRSRSPLIIRRVEEKEEIAGLNDRLAEYIDYVRHLDGLNNDLKRKYKANSKVEIIDVDKVKGMFEDELASLRRALDVMAKEKATLEVENRKMSAEWQDMKTKLARKEMEYQTLERKLTQYEKELAETRTERERFTSLRRDYEVEVRQVAELRKTLERESSARAEYEAKFMNVKKEMDFQMNLYKEEKSKWSTRRVEIEEEVESRARIEYESKLAAELAVMREQTQEDMRAYRLQIDSFFSNKFTEMKKMSEISVKTASSSKDEIFVFRRRLDEVNAELAKKHSQVEGLMIRVSELEKLLEDERRDFEVQVRMYREQNESLRMEMEVKFKEFNELMAIKVALDQEILAYSKLLESEELRCHLSHREKVVVTDAMRAQFAARSSATHRIDMDEEEADVEMVSTASHSTAAYAVKSSSSGPIEFLGCDSSGQFVTIKNTSSSDVVIGGWQLRYIADGKETLYKFPRNLSIKSGETCTVWSSETHTTHDPPHNIVMKGLTFFTGSRIQCFLLNRDDEMAVIEMNRGQRELTPRGYSTHRSTFEEHATSEERCSVM